jgi:hypothetical protein
MRRAGLVQRLRRCLAKAERLVFNSLTRPRRASAVTICKLRKKLAQAGADSVIGTVWGRGYTMRDPAAARPANPKVQPALARAPVLAEAA